MEESVVENTGNSNHVAERAPPNLVSVYPAPFASQLTSPKRSTAHRRGPCYLPKGRTQSFKIHKNFIYYYSPFFDTAFNGKTVEGECQGSEFDDTPHEVFGIFVNWLYMQRIKIDSDEWSVRCVLLVNVWLLADRVMVPRLQKEALLLLENAGRRDREFPPSQYERIYRKTTQDSPLRKCIVNMWPDRIISNSDSYPRELLVDIINRLGPIKRELEAALHDPLGWGFDNFHHDVVDEDIELPMGENRQSNDATLGAKKRKLDQTGFAEENRRESNA